MAGPHNGVRPALRSVRRAPNHRSGAFRFVAILPAVLLVVFGAVWLRDRAKGGFRPVDIKAAE